MDAWQEVEKQIATAKAEYIKYTGENPKLKAENTELNKQLIELNRKVAVAHGEYQDTIQLDKDLSIQINKRKADIDILVADKIDTANLKAEKIGAECNARIDVLNERESKLAERESNVTKQEKVNVAKYEELESVKVVLSSQSKEIEDATKVLNTQATDIQHEESMLKQRSIELDTKEATLAKTEEDLSERLKRVQASEIKAQSNMSNSERLLSTNELRGFEIDKRETFVKNKEEDLRKRELELKRRTDSFVNSLRAGKMV
jgi:chromosome segregation ATPase